MYHIIKKSIQLESYKCEVINDLTQQLITTSFTHFHISYLITAA